MSSKARTQSILPAQPRRRLAGAKESVVYPAAVMTAMGMGTLSLGIVFYARDVLHASPSQIGLLAATWSLSYILGCLLLRPLADRLLPRHSILLAVVTMSFAVAALLGVDRLAAVFLCYALYGFGTSFFWPPLMGWLSTGIEGPDLNRAMGRFNLCWSIGGIVGPVLAGYLAPHDPRLPVVAAGLLYLMAATYILGALFCFDQLGRDDDAHRRAVERRGSVTSVSEGTPLRFPAWGGVFAAYVVLGLIINVFPLAAEDQLGLSKPSVGLLLFGRALATTIALLTFGRTTAWHNRGGQLVIGLLAFAFVVFLLPTAGSVLLIGLLLLLVGVLSAQSYANSLFHGISGSRNRAARMAIHESLLSAGLICGGACGGILYQHSGYATACRAAAAILVLIAIVALGFLFRKKHRVHCDP